MSKIDKQVAPASAENLTLFGYFSKEKYLTKYFQKLGRADIYTVGDILKIENGRLFQIFPTSPANQKRIVDNLGAIGVHIR